MAALPCGRRAPTSSRACARRTGPARLALAAQVADVTTVNVAREDLREVMARLKMAQGFDVGLEMSGVQAALDQMVEALVMGGRIALLGIGSGLNCCMAEVVW
jgi:threonine dehydrogenase-like Zn-dependent dehydrogenase